MDPKRMKKGRRVHILHLCNSKWLTLEGRNPGARTRGARGRLIGEAPGQGHPMWLVRHDDGTVGAYSPHELERDRKRPPRPCRGNVVFLEELNVMGIVVSYDPTRKTVKLSWPDKPLWPKDIKTFAVKNPATILILNPEEALYRIAAVFEQLHDNIRKLTQQATLNALHSVELFPGE